MKLKRKRQKCCKHSYPYLLNPVHRSPVSFEISLCHLDSMQLGIRSMGYSILVKRKSSESDLEVDIKLAPGHG